MVPPPLEEGRRGGILTRAFTCRAVSPVISALLLVCIAVTASVVGYVYSTGVVYRLMGPPPSGIDQPSIESISYSSDGSAQLTVRNIGAGDFAVASIYIDGNLAYSAPQGIRIPVGEAWTFDISNVFDPGTAPTEHTFKVVTLKGYMVSAHGPQENAYVAYAITYETQYTTTFASSGLMTTTSTATTTSYVTSTGKTTITSTSTACKCGDTRTTVTTTITTMTTTISSTTITQTSTITSTGNVTIASTGTTTVTTDTT
jgi:hypothetical protein